MSATKQDIANLQQQMVNNFNNLENNIVGVQNNLQSNQNGLQDQIINNNTTEISIMYGGDFESQFGSFNSSDPTYNLPAKYIDLVHLIKSKNKNSLYLSGGDDILTGLSKTVENYAKSYPADVESFNLEYNKYYNELFNYNSPVSNLSLANAQFEMDYALLNNFIDASVLGNHEFDEGADDLVQSITQKTDDLPNNTIINTDNILTGGVNYPILTCNVKNISNFQLVFSNYYPPTNLEKSEILDIYEFKNTESSLRYGNGQEKQSYKSPNNFDQNFVLNNVLANSCIKTIDGKKIGLIGVSPPNFSQLISSPPSGATYPIFADSSLSQTIDATNQEISILKSRTDIIILLFHSSNGAKGVQDLVAGLNDFDIIICGGFAEILNNVKYLNKNGKEISAFCSGKFAYESLNSFKLIINNNDKSYKILTEENQKSENHTIQTKQGKLANDLLTAYNNFINNVNGGELVEIAGYLTNPIPLISGEFKIPRTQTNAPATKLVTNSAYKSAKDYFSTSNPILTITNGGGIRADIPSTVYYINIIQVAAFNNSYVIGDIAISDVVNEWLNLSNSGLLANPDGYGELLCASGIFCEWDTTSGITQKVYLATFDDTTGLLSFNKNTATLYYDINDTTTYDNQVTFVLSNYTARVGTNDSTPLTISSRLNSDAGRPTFPGFNYLKNGSDTITDQIAFATFINTYGSTAENTYDIDLSADTFTQYPLL